MKLTLILFIIGIMFVAIGIGNKMYEINTENGKTIETKYVPRKVYDDLVLSNTLN